jgi:PIN domain
MAGRVLFIDFENVQKIDLAEVPADVRVRVFYGVTQKRIPEELVVQAQPLGARLEWLKIAGQGPNALDFHIAFYLGQELTRSPSSDCAILSRDTGFDPLIRHLHASGHTCRRAGSLKDAFPVPQPTADGDHFARLLTLLQKEKARPTKPKGLAGKVRSWFPKLTDAQRQALFDRLFKESKVRLADKVLTYDM